MICEIEGCGQPTGVPGTARGLCVAHYHRLRRYGDPTFAPERQTRSASERFWERVEKTETCWLWRGAVSPQGYGVFRRGPQDNTAAHRMAYELLVGSIPGGLHIDHLCRVRHCVNPTHLEPVTPTENARRAGAAKTHCLRGGHEYTPENTIVEKDGHRRCRQCRREHDRAYIRSKA